MKTVFDERDFRLGDSLVQSVFDNGISASDVVVLLISKNTIERPWIREEMDASIVQMLKGHLRVIPVLLDGVAPPPPLAHRIYLRVTDAMSVDDVAQKIANAVFEKPLPDIGKPPTYAGAPHMSGYTNIDVLVFEFIIRTRLKQVPEYPWIETSKIREFARTNDITEDMLLASLYSLRGYLQEINEAGTALPIAYAPTSLGVEKYLTATDPSYCDSVTKVVSAIVNDHDGMAGAVAQRANLEASLVEIILDNLEERGYLQLEKYAEGIYITPMPTLSRLLA
jgi:hypothetical protein